MISNVLYVIFIGVWCAIAIHERNGTALGGLFLGVSIGIYYESYRRKRREVESMSEMVVAVHYHDAAGVCQELKRATPSGFSSWTPVEKLRWVRRAEKDLMQQAERDKARGV